MASTGPIGGPLLGVVKGAAEKYALDWINENAGRGPNALGPMSQKIDEITEEVYCYSATIQTAIQYSIKPRVTDVQKAASCSIEYKPNEVAIAQEVVRDLRTLRDRVGVISSGAADRAKEDVSQAQVAGTDAGRSLAYAGRQNNKPGMRQFNREVGRATRAEAFFGSNLIIIRRKSANLARQIDSLITEIETDIEELRQSALPFLQARKECSEWLVRMEDPAS